MSDSIVAAIILASVIATVTEVQSPVAAITLTSPVATPS